MEITQSQLTRIDAVKERQELGQSFTSALERLREDHQDLRQKNPGQFARWEAFLVDFDDLALGAAVAMMDVRDARKL